MTNFHVKIMLLQLVTVIMLILIGDELASNLWKESHLQAGVQLYFSGPSQNQLYFSGP